MRFTTLCFHLEGDRFEFSRRVDALNVGPIVFFMPSHDPEECRAILDSMEQALHEARASLPHTASPDPDTGEPDTIIEEA